MKYLAIILVAVLAILIVVFISWFLNMKANGKCPLCALKKIFIPTKLTIDISEDEEYSENKVAQTPPMGWSSWNTFRNNIDQDIIMQTAHAMKVFLLFFRIFSILLAKKLFEKRKLQIFRLNFGDFQELFEVHLRF